MSSSTKSFLKILSAFAFAGSVYWVISTTKTNPFSIEPEPVIAVITSLIALIIAIYQKDSGDESPKPTVIKNNTVNANGNNNTVLQDVQNTHFNPVTQNHYGSGDNVSGGKTQK
jgi:hypothetical protein